MNGSEFQAYHVRQAITRLRRLIANATTPAVKARLIEQAEEHERFAALRPTPKQWPSFELPVYSP